MANPESQVTIHMAASPDAFVARKDGTGDWLETSDEFAAGDTMEPESDEAVIKTMNSGVVVSWCLPILVGHGMQLFEGQEADAPLHLQATKAYKSGMLALRSEVRRVGRPSR